MKYLTLTTSNSSLSKRFRVVADGFVDNLSKKQTVQITLDGALDVSIGSIFRVWNFVIRVRETEAEEDYGSYEDLKQFYKYNNPNGTPSNVLTLVDHYGDTYQVIFSGDFQAKPFATTLVGTEAWYFIQTTFMCITEETEPES